MKTIILTLSILMISASLYGQTNIRKLERENSTPTNSTSKSISKQNLCLDSVIIELYDELSPNPVDYRKEIYDYDGSGNNIKQIDYWWNKASNKWDIKFKREFTYDSNDNLIKYIFFSADLNTGNWDGYQKIEYSYDQNRKLLLEIQYTWKTKWVESIKIDYSFDLNGNLSLCHLYKWSQSSSKWEMDSKIEHKYDSNNKLKSSIRFNFISALLYWNEGIKWEYFYDLKGNLTLCNVYYWDNISGKYNLDSKYDFPLDLNQNLKEMKQSVWDVINMKWNEEGKTEYFYDNSILLNEISFSYFRRNVYLGFQFGLIFNDFFDHKLTNIVYSITNKYSGLWDIMERDKYYYSEHTVTGIEENRQGKCMVYPNPSKDFITFDINTNEEPSVVELYDSKGRMVLKIEIPKDKRIQVKDLPRGLYIYKLNHLNTVRTGKIILQ